VNTELRSIESDSTGKKLQNSFSRNINKYNFSKVPLSSLLLQQERLCLMRSTIGALSSTFAAQMSSSTDLCSSTVRRPAAVSPPASGLLGSRDLGINIHALAASSPRFTPSSLLSDNGDFPSSRSDFDMDDEDSDDEDEGSSPAAEGLSLTMEEDEPLEDGMFDLDLGGTGDSPSPHLIPLPHIGASTTTASHLATMTRPTPLPRHVSPSESDSAASLSSSPASGLGRSQIRSTDSGFGSLSRSAQESSARESIRSTIPQSKAPLVGFFPPSNSTSS